VNDYGARASRDLIVTRGADFRKEKNKKKRGVSQRFDCCLPEHLLASIWDTGELVRRGTESIEGGTGGGVRREDGSSWICSDRARRSATSSELTHSQSYAGGEITMQTHSIKFDD
jgi:hypothetical protein